ncbi:acireductone dioxygenase [Synechococcus sp. KORDI-52]|uniref:1,2-dihydroxy-3-keto-5-methylthiopentene dioxygenase n=1 Tax=Synechococcus sp. KORDI-52 TaxID=585425 RepID=UPI0004E03561|nr:acireductone dioxygenase [Synechococcus sp. KORDI-52]AII48727.1 acireductone dioxygenase [Synechococcus sp. KORDI-52]
MSRLSIFPDETASDAPDRHVLRLESHDPAVIQAELRRRGIGFEQWPAEQGLPEGADKATILQVYATAIARVQRDGSYATVDAIRMTPDHPDRESLRCKFLEEHTHAEDEVRFFVEGYGLFVLHIGSEVLSVLCERGDLMRVPAGTRHWFDMGSQPRFCAVRWFNNPEGWVAQYTGSSIAQRFPRLD